jgi:hypothetical protein
VARFATAVTPDLRMDPRAALRDMRLKGEALSTLTDAVRSAGMALEEGAADDPYADSSGNTAQRQFSLLRSRSDEAVVLQIPDWVANDGNKVGALEELRDALMNRKVRIIAPKIEKADYSLEKTMPVIWRKMASIDLEFVSWRYVEEMKQGKLSAARVFGLAAGAAPAAPVTVPAGPAIKRVFIGSTGKDLRPYREAAREICSKLELFPMMMEDWEAMGLGATAGSKKKLDQADLYVGLFAHRYGYVEQGYDRSVTEIEFDYAGQRTLERLCFMLDPSHPWPQDAADPEHHVQMTAFRQRVERLIRAQFTTVDDFRVKLMQALIPHRP